MSLGSFRYPFPSLLIILLSQSSSTQTTPLSTRDAPSRDSSPSLPHCTPRSRDHAPKCSLTNQGQSALVPIVPDTNKSAALLRIRFPHPLGVWPVGIPDTERPQTSTPAQSQNHKHSIPILGLSSSTILLNCASSSRVCGASACPSSRSSLSQCIHGASSSTQTYHSRSQAHL